MKEKFGPAAPRLVTRIPEIPRNAMGKPLRASLAKKYGES
jgi:acyl-coenzyme A synthetase/AMP-(fatty) acid ligase